MLQYDSAIIVSSKLNRNARAPFTGRSFRLSEVVEISREERDVYLIPQNFVDTGTILGGTVKLRNAVEAAVLAVGSAVPLFYLPLAFNIRLMIVIAVSVPLAVFGVVGFGGDSLTQFVAHWFRFMKRRRIVTPTPQGNLDANRHRHLRFISKRYRVVYYNNSLVSLDNFNTRIYKNANMAILGTSGAGKTFTMQLIARRMRLAGTPVYIIAPLKGHEFYRQAKALNGTIIRIVPGSPDCINVMEIRKIDHTSSELLDGPMPEQSELAAKIQKLHIFFSLLIPDLSNEERQLLDEAIVTTYRNKGITYDNASPDDPARPGQYREMPILGDLHAVLSAAPETRRIANILNRLVHGSASSFNRQTNVNLDNSYVVIDISELSGDLLTVGMYIGLDYMWDKAKEDLTRRKQIFIDEVWQIIGASSNALAANYVFEAVKTIRGYGGGVLVATQDLNDFFSLEDGKYGRGILNNCKIKIILNLEEEEAQRVQSVLKLTDAEIDNITRFECGSALIVTNSNNVTVDMRCSEEEKDLITTDRDELRRIVERKMQNQTKTEES